MRQLIFAGVATALFLSGCGSSAGPTTSACSISYKDTEIHLSSGGVSCTELEQQGAALGELWQSGGLANNPVTPGIADYPQTACALAKNGQTATISYGSTFGLASEANLICTDLIADGWTQQ